MRKCLTEDATKSLVNALVIPKLDYCNSLLFGVKQTSLMKLQRVQNYAARLIKKVKNDSIQLPLSKSCIGYL